jgi:hypothetical protein
MKFNTSATTVGWMKYEDHPKTVAPLYRASPEFALTFGEPFKSLLSKIDLSGGKYVSIDSRAHMLMPDWYAAIPGFHCDDFWRPEGQPDLENLRPIKHFAVVINAEVATTEYVVLPKDLPSPTQLYEVYGSDRPLYGIYNEIIEASKPSISEAQDGEIIRFSGLDFHRVGAAKKAGWRAFIRVTVSDHREPKDEVRTQTQVYLTDPFRGW